MDTNQSLQYKVVKWLSSPVGWWKCNTRNSDEDLMIAKCLKIVDTTNLIAEDVAIREGLFNCRENNFSHVLI
ncbi:hypothetical protein H5410_014531 [Solanum commersonii]|uniref:Uncharacterized protein n=1 Tax=Solanum commersonii TaxID=4109 RepID=A0A9J5ZRH9_SOLCO|nr:hypothetical protein H5410_014531 [Solanum commersonii]